LGSVTVHVLERKTGDRARRLEHRLGRVGETDDLGQLGVRKPGRQVQAGADVAAADDSDSEARRHSPRWLMPRGRLTGARAGPLWGAAACDGVKRTARGARLHRVVRAGSGPDAPDRAAGHARSWHQPSIDWPGGAAAP